MIALSELKLIKFTTYSTVWLWQISSWRSHLYTNCSRKLWRSD